MADNVKYLQLVNFLFTILDLKLIPIKDLDIQTIKTMSKTQAQRYLASIRSDLESP